MEKYNIISFAGMFILMGIAWIFSNNRSRMNWHLIAWGTGLQMLFALFVFTIPAGSILFLKINGVVIRVLEVASKGAEFVFGPLALQPGTKGSLGFILAFQAFPTIIFFSALVSILYFYNILPAVIRAFAGIFTRLMKISGAESLCTATNIFMGIESMFMIRPHVEKMTKSELCTILTAGMSTVASNVMALYVFTLREQFPTIAGHLISASLLSAPAALIMSKILYPEMEKPLTLGVSVKVDYKKEGNLFEAIINGAQSGLKVIAGITALLIAVLGLVALADMVFLGLGGKINGLLGVSIDWSLKGLLGYLFYPLTLLMGVPYSDAGIISKIIGERMIVTEVIAYQDLASAIASGSIEHPRSILLASYALCGFAHLASMAIFVGGISALAPGRTRALSQMAFRALWAATFACLMTSCVAGTFFMNTSILMGK